MYTHVVTCSAFAEPRSGAGPEVGAGKMPSRTLQVTEDAYELLASLKQDRESFTDVIKRLAGERSLFDIVGVLDEEQARRLEARIEQGRERSRKRRAKQLRRG